MILPMQVRIIPENRQALKDEAKKNLRSIQGEANKILADYFEGRKAMRDAFAALNGLECAGVAKGKP